MAGRRETAGVRRTVRPPAAGRSLTLAAAWTGAGAAIVSAVIASVVVAVLWLPAANGAGSAVLGQAAALQTVVFAAACGVAARLSALGTSHVSVFAAVLAGFVLFAGTGGVAFVRASPLRDELAEWTPQWFGPALRAAAAGLTVYLGAGALLVAGSLVLHHGRVETLSGQVGGGWSGVPILLLGVLAAPNAAIAGASYLAGPGFAVGSGSGVSLGSTVHGTLPAFPVLGAVPSGPATSPVWLLTAVTPVLAGACVARAVSAEPSWLLRLRSAGIAGVLAVLLGMLLGWQGGGAIGSGRLSAFGASPWQFGLAVGAALSVMAAVSIASLQAVSWWRERGSERIASAAAALTAVLSVADNAADGDDDEDDILAG
jgi:hypothetical protein